MGLAGTWKWAALLMLFLATACGESTRKEALDELTAVMGGAKACSATIECVLAGQSNCSCAAPVNALFVSRINEAVADVNRTCAPEEFLGDCIAYQEPRCVQGQCVADPR